MKEMDLLPWLIRMSQGDEEAFQEVYEATCDEAYRLIYYLVPNKQDAPDLMNEVYMELLRSVSNYQHEQRFSAWFNGLIVRQVRNWKRKGWQRFRLLEKLKSTPAQSHDQGREDSYAVVSSRSELLPLLNQLPLKQREVIVLRYYQDSSLEEIAEVLNIPLGTVKSRHHHALNKLRRLAQDNRQEGEIKGYVH